MDRSFFELYVKSPVARFSAGDREAFEERLRHLAAATQLRPITAPHELQLDANGQTIRGGLRLSAVSFRRLAAALATGANHFLAELAGTIRTTRNDNDLVDGDLARQTWNGLVETRFPHISRHRMLCDAGGRTIDGFAKAGYVPFIREDVYTAARDALAGSSFAFYAAVLVGRAMTVWFRERVPAWHYGGRDFYRGWYVAVGELAGIAPRITPAVLFPQGICLAPFHEHGRLVSTRMASAGAARLSRAFAAAVANGFPDAPIAAGIAETLFDPLGFAANGDPTRQRERVAAVAQRAAAADVPVGVAKQAAASALSMGRNIGRPAQPEITTAYAARTVFDLLVPLCQLGRQMPLRHRERIEQAAFRLLTEGQWAENHGPADSSAAEDHSHDTAIVG